MNHERAKVIFEEIRERPYGVSVVNGEVCNNCYYKGIELLEKLGELGYAVRGRIGETYWDTAIIPAEVVAGWPADVDVTHFYVEAETDGAWRDLDPSLQPAMARHGFTVCTWETGGTCFPITKLYTQEENIAYQEKWANDALVEAYFERAGPSLCALNEWFAANA